MVDESPLSICVLGGGPVGIETALYGRFLGYRVTLFELGEIGQTVRNSGPGPLATPFRSNCSSLGLAALAAQDTAYNLPSDADLLTPMEWVERYLEPLTRSDLLADCCSTQSKVTAVAHLIPEDPEADDDRGRFRIEVENAHTGQLVVTADVVVDCTGGETDGLFDVLLVGDLPPNEASPATADTAAAVTYLNPAPNFYVLGAKSRDGNHPFTAAEGVDQVRDLFQQIGGRAGLDLYATAATLL